MLPGFKIAMFGSSLLSSYWNGAATYYRGMLRELARRGARITFFEPDAYNRQQHRDIAPPDWAKVVVYEPTEASLRAALARTRGADMIIKCSGIGVFDTLLEAEIPKLARTGTLVAFWDVDAPATLERIEANPADPFLPYIPTYDFIFTYGGGEPVINAYTRHGARACIPIYNALDPETHHPVPPDPRFAADLSFLGNRLPDREARVEDFFLCAAEAHPEGRFLLGGNGWLDKPVPPNVTILGHVGTADHNAFNCSARAVLNISRDSMARFGFSPATRVFEAAGAGACLITDAWEGIHHFLEPDHEVLVAHNGQQVAGILRNLTPERARGIGEAARRRVLADHTYAQRAAQWESVVSAALPGVTQ